MTIKMCGGLPLRNSCQQCGLKHDKKCYAETATCNRCNKIGHYPRVCKSKANGHTYKSENSKQRDRERMTAFINRKTAETSLPFYHADIDFILSSQTNSSILTTSDNFSKQNNLRTLNVKLVKKVCDLRNQNETLQKIVKETLSAVNIFQTENKRLENRFKEGQTVMQQMVISMATTKSALQGEKEENQKLHIKIQELKKQMEGNINTRNKQDLFERQK